MAPFLADKRVLDFDIIAVQEPWNNPFGRRTYCVPGFTQTYDNCRRRSCFLVNQRLDITTWEVEFPRDDLTTVPWSKPSTHGQPWWMEAISDIVQAERIAKRGHKWDECKRLSKAKGNMVKESQRRCFRDRIHESAQTGGIWALAKWGKKAGGHVESPTMPKIAYQGGFATTIEGKAEALRARFYPEVIADLSDITDTSWSDDSCPDAVEVVKSTTAEEVRSLLATRSAGKAPGNDSISNEFLKTMGTRLCAAVAVIATASWKLGHYPERFKRARTVVLRKPNKATYEEAGSWRPIALLNTIGKLVEAITAKRITEAIEQHGLIPNTQMGARRGRSIETALELLTEQIQTVWKSPKHVVTMLLLDLFGAFDTVHPERMLDVLRKRRMPGWVVRWVQSFMTNRTTTLVLQGHETKPFNITAGVPQGSTLSLILFLIYAAELLEICERPFEGITAVGFADDTNILAYSESTESNCRKLERVHERCLEWARKHGMKFAPGKYELVHFTRRTKAFNLRATCIFGDVVKEPTAEVRVLGVWLDAKLKWRAHARKVAAKAASQAGALTRITASTWGASLVRARLIYSSVIRPAITYGAPTWHEPSKGKAIRVGLQAQKAQNRALRTVTGAFKATPIRALEVEAYVPPMDLYLHDKIANFQQRLDNSPVQQQIVDACKRIQRRTKQKIKQRQIRTTGEKRKEWANSRIRDVSSSTKRIVLERWRERWDQAEKPGLDPVWHPPDKKVLQLHKDLRKAESTALVQLRTGRIGLAWFLSKRGVPGFIDKPG
ncbi:putative RNA-directed DNA polymerase from transposon X-element, partial [Lachnellula suecica]